MTLAKWHCIFPFSLKPTTVVELCRVRLVPTFIHKPGIYKFWTITAGLPILSVCHHPSCTYFGLGIGFMRSISVEDKYMNALERHFLPLQSLGNYVLDHESTKEAGRFLH